MTTDAQPLVSARHLDTFDPETVDAALRGAALDHIQLGTGQFRADWLHARLGDDWLDFGSYNLPLLALGEMPRDRVTLGFILAGNGASLLNGQELQQPGAALYSEGAELHYRLAPGSQWLAFAVRRETLEAASLELAERFEGPLRLEAGPRQRLQRALYKILQQLRSIGADSPAVPDGVALARQLHADLVDAYCAALPATAAGCSPGGADLGDNAQLFGKAVEYLHDHLDGVVRIGNLCATLKTSWTSLERIFLARCGTTPKGYLTLLRLARARRKLLAASPSDDSVTRIAQDCGLPHLGRFAQRYRATYGESPSQTLVRRG